MEKEVVIKTKIFDQIKYVRINENGIEDAQIFINKG